ncbi:MAG: hypothetical protein FJ296_02790 [Planctomycetes bacterium]|nr:hypothetical protein [Planctomycetota bacterium]
MHRPLGSALLASLLLLAAPLSAQFTNGSFETGDFTGWIAEDMADPFEPLDVSTGGFNNGLNAFTAEPTDGANLAITGFDGDGPGTISLAQDVSIPASASTLQFDWGGGWDTLNFGSSTLDRVFSVVIEEQGGGEVLATLEVVRAEAGTFMDDTGLTTSVADLSAFAGQTVLVRFLWDVPESFTGPAVCQLDNVRLVGKQLPAAEAASFRASFNFVTEESDSVRLDVVVPTPDGFEPDGEVIDVTIGDLERSFDLDAAGKGSDELDTVRVQPLPGDAAHLKVSLRCKGGDFLFDFIAYGLDDFETAPGGETFEIPVSVTLDGETTDSELLVVYKATPEKSGKAVGRNASEARPTKLVAQLDFAEAGNDSIAFKGWALAPAGLLLDGEELVVDIGSVQRVFTLDESGTGVVGPDSITVKRDKRNPALFAVTMSVSQADLADTLSDDGLVEDDLPAPGMPVPLQLRVTLGGLVRQVLADVTWVAQSGKSGKATFKG